VGPEVDEKASTIYIDNDPEDTVEKATERLYQQPKSGIFSFFMQYLRCLTHSSDDALPDLEDSFSEPLPSNYNTLKNGKKIGM
jgi:hypothetical protein